MNPPSNKTWQGPTKRRKKTPRTCEQSCSHVDNLYFRCSFQHTEQTSIFNKMNKFNLFESLCSTFFNQRNPLQGQSIDGIRSIRSIRFFLVQSLLTSIFNIFHQGSMVQPDFPPEKPQGRTWLGLLLLLAAAGSAEVRIFNSPSDVFFFFLGGKTPAVYMFSLNKTWEHTT